MRKLIASLYVSLDGFAADSSEQMRWVTDDFGEEITSYSPTSCEAQTCSFSGE